MQRKHLRLKNRANNNKTGEDMNEAKEKLQIEQAFGLAKDEILTPITRTRNGETFVTGARREPWRSFHEQLTREQQQAADHIEICHRIYSGALDYRMMQSCLDGGGGHSEVNPAEKKSQMLTIYDKWRASLVYAMPQVLAACLDVCGEGMTFQQASANSHGLMSDKTVKRYVIIGLDDYVSITQRRG